jgi:hypothetical protein
MRLSRGISDFLWLPTRSPFTRWLNALTEAFHLVQFLSISVCGEPLTSTSALLLNLQLPVRGEQDTIPDDFFCSTFGGASRYHFVLEAHPKIDSGKRYWHRWEDILLSIMPALACRLLQKIHENKFLLISLASYSLDPTFSEKKVSSSPLFAFAPWSYIRSFWRKERPFAVGTRESLSNDHLLLSVQMANLTPCLPFLMVALRDLTLIFPNPLASLSQLKLHAFLFLAKEGQNLRITRHTIRKCISKNLTLYPTVHFCDSEESL